MIHFALFGYFFVVLVGIVCLAISLFLYLRIKSRFLFNFLVYFSAFTLFVLSYLVVLTYIRANLKPADFYGLLLVLAAVIFSYSFLLFSILHFGHFMVYEKSSTKRNTLEILIGVVAFIGLSSSFEINWNEEQIHQLGNFGAYFSCFLPFVVIGYSLVLKLTHLKNLDDEKRRIVKRTSIMSIIFIPGFILDYYLVLSGNFFLFVPGFYFCSSIIYLKYFIKKHNVDLSSIRSIGDPRTYDDYLIRIGISTREKEIVVLIMMGFSNRKIANKLFISLSTVKTHVRNIFRKLNVESRFEIITRLKNAEEN